MNDILHRAALRIAPGNMPECLRQGSAPRSTGGGCWRPDGRLGCTAGLIVWHRPERWGSWYTLDVAPQILEAMKEGGGGSNRDA